MPKLCQLVRSYREWSASRYKPAQRWKRAKTHSKVLNATKHLMDIVGADIPANDVDCKLLYKVQWTLAERELCRSTINGYVATIQRMYRWAAHPARDMVPEHVAQRLSMLDALESTRSPAAEPEPVEAVSIQDVQETCLYVRKASIVAMVWLQWHSGMRPGEVCDIRKSWLDTSSSPWVYSPREHKMAHLNIKRNVALGPKSQECLLPWLAEADGDLVFPSWRHWKKPINEGSYREHLHRVQRRHGLKVWSPNQIRHSYAERLAAKAERGERDAQIMLGHANIETTRRYIGIDVHLPRKKELAMQFG